MKPAVVSACTALAWFGAIVFSGCQTPTEPPETPLPPLQRTSTGTPAQVDFATHIKPVLQEKCVMCHNDAILPGRPGFESAAHAFRPGPKGPAIVPGRPDQSRIVQVLRAAEESEETMPPAGHRVTEQELALIEAWIRQGAPWPRGAAGRIPYDPVPFDDRERGMIHSSEP